MNNRDKRNKLIEVIDKSLWSDFFDVGDGLFLNLFLFDFRERVISILRVEARHRIPDRVEESHLLVLTVSEPVGRPDTMEIPALAFEDFLTEAVSIPRHAGGMIGSAIAFNGKDIGRLLWVFDAEVDAVRAATDLGIDLIAVLVQEVIDLFFERGFEAKAVSAWHAILSDAIFGIVEVTPKQLRAFGFAFGDIKVAVTDGTDDDGVDLSAGDRDVKTAFATSAVKRTEVMSDIAGFIFAIADGEDDDVSFIALDGFEVLDE